MPTPEIPPPALPPSVDEELAALRLEEEARLEAEEAEAKARELEELRLTKSLSLSMGKRGVDFEIVNHQLGVFAVRKPDSQGIKQVEICVGLADYSKGKPINEIKLIGILRNYVVGDQKMLEFHRLAQSAPGLATGQNSVLAAFNSLAGGAKFEGKKNS